MTERYRRTFSDKAIAFAGLSGLFGLYGTTEQILHKDAEFEIIKIAGFTGALIGFAAFIAGIAYEHHNKTKVRKGVEDGVAVGVMIDANDTQKSIQEYLNSTNTTLKK